MRIIQGIEEYTKIRIGMEMDTRMKNEICLWEQTNMGEMFKRYVMEKVMEKYISIHELLHRIKDKIKGLTSPINFQKKILLVLFPSLQTKERSLPETSS